jgi:glutamyl-tRNA synthetase
MVIARFSPSPTGNIHVGNVRTALINYLFVKKNKGKFILRMDDTDPKRSDEKFAANIKADLTWLGVEWHEFYKQSDKLAYYNKIKQELISKKIIYPCFESEEELNLKRKSQLSRGAPPIYDRASLNLNDKEVAQQISNGIDPHYRFKLDEKEISWYDGVRGKIIFKERAFSDPVVFRADGSPTYTFCSVIDDIDYNITDIIRGEDHISNTAVQIQIFRSLTNKLPNFHHLSLLKTKDAEISKRIGGFEISALREEGVDPFAINSLLTRLGTSDNIEACTNFTKLIEDFSIDKFSKSAVLYNVHDLYKLNHKIIAKREFAELKNITDKANIINQEFWNLIKENLNSYNEIEEWFKIINNKPKIKFLPEEREVLLHAKSLITEDLIRGNLKEWVNKISKKTGKKGKELYHPIRLALTGKDSGPELSKIIPILGLKNITERLDVQ